MLAPRQQRTDPEEYPELQPLKRAEAMSLGDQLRKAKADEAALERHLHRVLNPKALTMLRTLRQKIENLEAAIRAARITSNRP